MSPRSLAGGLAEREERADQTARSLVDRARQYGQREHRDPTGRLVLRVSYVRGLWHVTGRDRRVRHCSAEVEARWLVALLLEQQRQQAAGGAA